MSIEIVERILVLNNMRIATTNFNPYLGFFLKFEKCCANGRLDFAIKFIPPPYIFSKS